MPFCCMMGMAFFDVKGVAWCRVEGAAPSKPSLRGVARLRVNGVAMVGVWELACA